MSAPHLGDVEPITSRRGAFWVRGERLETPGGTLARGPLYVWWEAPADPAATRAIPIVLVHGGGGQSTDYLHAIDGGPGWASMLVAEGYAVYVVDRVGHGRSPLHPDVLGAMGPPFSYEFALGLFAPGHRDHTQWIGGREIGDPLLDQVISPSGPMLADLGAAQALDADRLARLLDRIGPAFLVTHSAGGPSGWLTAAARPQLTQAVVAVEPIGPPYADLPGLGTLTHGLTAAPMDPATLAGLPILVVSGEASVFATFDELVVDFLRDAGAAAQRLHLPDVGIRGNGHAMMLERNAREVLQPILDWLDPR
jgi:pimeloyl-ACP methyl ester carboxylesterase